MKFHGTIDYQGDVLILKSLVLDTGTAMIDVIDLLHGTKPPTMMEIHPMRAKPDNIKKAAPTHHLTLMNTERMQHD